MSSLTEQLRASFGQLPEEYFAEIDRRLADPNDSIHTAEVDWLPPPRDPFDDDWKWLVEASDEEGEVREVDHSEDQTSVSTAPSTYRFPRRRVFAALAWAASILLVVSVDRLLVNRAGEGDLDAGAARVTAGGALGGQAWTVRVPSQRRAFVTFAILGPNNRPEFHPEAGKFLEAGPDKPLDYGLEGNVGDSLFVVLTETPAADLLNNETVLAVNGGKQPWQDPDSFRDFLEEKLRSLGYRHFTVRKLPLAR